MSGTRREDAAAVLARLGLDPAAVREGRVSAAEIAPHLADPDATALVTALGELASPAVAALLAALEPPAVDRGLRKEIRRALYRLRQRGVPAPAPPASPTAVRPAAPPDAEGFLSAFDARGDRVAWLVRALSGGGSLVIASTINEPAGLRDVYVAETSRKQLREVRRRMEAEGVPLVAAGWRVVDALLVEAHERAGAGAAERDYLRIRHRLTAEPPAPPAEPVSARVPAPAPEERAGLAARSQALLEEPELRGWYPTPEAAQPYVAEIAALRESPLVLSRVAEEERVREVLRRAAAALFPPDVLARRLEGTAYVLAERGRAEPARQALAVAALVRDAPADALGIPLIAALVERGVGSLLAESTAREEEARRSSLVLTPGQVVRDRSSSRPGRTRS